MPFIEALELWNSGTLKLWHFESLNTEKGFTPICTNYPQILEDGNITLIMPAALGINTNSLLVKGYADFTDHCVKEGFKRIYCVKGMGADLCGLWILVV